MILIDSRGEREIEKIFIENKIEYKIQSLPIGDIIYTEKNIVIERKEISDFYQSIITNRLFEQAMNMSLNFNKCFIIIIGSENELYKKIDFKINVFLGAIASISVRYGVQILRVNNKQQYVRLVQLLINKCNKGGLDFKKIKRLKIKDEDILISMLSCIPQISYKKASSILSIYKLKINLLDNNGNEIKFEDFIKIKSIGKKTANILINFLNKYNNEVKNGEM